MNSIDLPHLTKSRVKYFLWILRRKHVQIFLLIIWFQYAGQKVSKSHSIPLDAVIVSQHCGFHRSQVIQIYGLLVKLKIKISVETQNDVNLKIWNLTSPFISITFQKFLSLLKFHFFIYKTKPKMHNYLQSFNPVHETSLNTQLHSLLFYIIKA